MSRWPSEALRSLAARAGASPALGAMRGTLRTLVRPDAVFIGGDDIEAAVAAFAGWCAGHPGHACEIGLGSRLAAVCVAPLGTSLSRKELADYGRRQFAHYFGGSFSGGGDAAAWRVAASGDAHAPLAFGVPEALAAGLQQAARAHRVRLARIAPWWAQPVWRAASSAPSTVMAVEPGACTQLSFEDGRLHRVAVWEEPGTEPHDQSLEAPTATVIRLMGAGSGQPRSLPATWPLCGGTAVAQVLQRPRRGLALGKRVGSEGPA